MLREFSKELPEDREFEIGGETFRWQHVHWTVAAKMMDDANKPQNGQAFTWKSDTEVAIKEALQFIDPEGDSHKRWKALMARKENPVPQQTIVNCYNWLQSQACGLPTRPPSDSLPGGGSNDTSSVGGAS